MFVLDEYVRIAEHRSFLPPRKRSVPDRSTRSKISPGHACIVYVAFTISSTIFFASENSIMVLSRKNSSFSIPA